MMNSNNEVGETPREERLRLMMELSRTDYVTAKIIEADTPEEQQAIREQYADVIAQRKAWRARINELEGVE